MNTVSYDGAILDIARSFVELTVLSPLISIAWVEETGDKSLSSLTTKVMDAIKA